jgi:hypothetical protein
MFELSKSELDDLRCQIGTSKWGGTRYIPFAFTEQGVAMLSGVLNSDRAIKVNIQIVRTFTQLRNMLANHEDLKHKIEVMEKNMMNNFGSYSKRLHSCWRWMKSRKRRLVISKKARLNMAIATGKIEYRLK